MDNKVEIVTFTGLWNRQTFCKETEKTIKQDTSKDYVVLRWDIDQFAMFNDTYGSDVGDNVLKSVANLQFARFNEMSGIVTIGHYNADHFVMCYIKGEVEPQTIMDNIMSDLNKSFPDYYFTIHMGLCEVDKDIDIGLCCDRALIAIRKAKKSYRVGYDWYDDQMRKQAIFENDIYHAMRDALKNGEFVPFVQPQYDFSTGDISGAEILVRWLKPNEGTVSPGLFIPVFEKNGFIFELDKYICEEACKLYRTWLDKGYNLPSISVNVSRHDTYRTDFIQTLISIVEKYNIPFEKIHIELTETAYVDNADKFIEIITRLRAKGFIVEMDDFGSGYSSLNALKDLPIHTLKLDLGFLRNTTEDNRSRGGNIISSVVRMAHYLGVNVIAEGVETKVQAEYLSSIGCNNMQGYYFAKPMPADDFEELIAKQGKQSEREELNTGVEDAADFLDASVQNTLLFNSFLGGAAIVEYDGKNASILRINDKFFETIGGSKEMITDKRYTVFDLLDANTKKGFCVMLEKAYQTGKETEGVLCYPSRRGEKYNIWLSVRARFLTRKYDKLLFYISGDNISEKKRLELENERLSSELQSIVDNIPGGIAIFKVKDDEFHCEFVSGGFYAQRGYSEVDFNESTFDLTQSVHPEDKEHVKAKIFDSIHNGKPFYDVYRIIARDKSLMWVEARSKFVGKPNDGLLYIYSNDITSIINMREQGEYDKQELQSLINSLTGGVAVFKVLEDNTFITDYISESASAISGYTAEEFKTKFNKKVADIVFAGDIQNVFENARNVIENGEEVDVISRVIAKSGDIVWVKIHAKRVIRAKQVYIHLVFQSITDITDIYGQILDESDSSLMIIDRNTHELLFVNDAAARLAGRDKKDMIGMHCFDFMHGRNKICDDCPVLKLGEKPIYRTTHRKDGVVLYEKYRAVKWNGHDAYISFITDKTEEYKKQETLEDLVSKIPGGLAIIRHTREEHKYIYFSDVAKKLLGYEPKENPFETGYPNKYINKKDYADLIEIAKNARDGVEKDLRIYKNGVTRWVHLESKFWRKDTSGYFYEFVVYSDITERKETEVELNIRDAEYRASALQSGKMICRYFIKTKSLIVAPEVAQAFDIFERLDDAPTYIVKNGYISKDTITAWYNIFEGIEKGNKEGNSIVHVSDIKGKFRWFSASYITLFDENNMPERAIISFDDITEKRKVDRYQTLMKYGTIRALKAIYPAILLCNISKNRFSTLEYEDAEGLERNVDGEYDSFLEMGVKFIPDKVEADDFSCRFSRDNLIKEFKEGNDIVKLTHRQLDKNGIVHWMETIIMHVPDNYDNEVNAIAISRCIDDIKKKEDELQNALQIVSGELKINEIEAETRLSMAQLGKMICRYDITSGMIFVPKDMAIRHGTSEFFKAPRDVSEIGSIITDKKNQKKYYDLFKAIQKGDISGSVEIKFSPAGCAPYYETANFVNIFDDNKKPVRAVLAIEDTTSQHIALEKYDQLKQNELVMRIVAEHSKRIILYYDASTQFVTAMDKQMAEKYGIDISFDINKASGTKMHVTNESKAALHVVYTSIISGKSGNNKLHVACLDNVDRWFDICYTVFKDNNNKVTGAVISLLDVTSRHEEEVAFARYSQNTLQRSQEGLAYVEFDLTDNTLERFGGLDLQNINIGAKAGDNYSDVLAKYLSIRFPKDLQIRILNYFSREHLLTLFKDGQKEIYDQWHLKYNDAGLRWVSSTVELIADPYSGHVKGMLTVKNITEEKNAHIEAQRRAELDGLTNIYNRASTEMMIEKHLSEPDTIPGVLIMFDLDYLKEINDYFGHQEGDKALRTFATTLKRHFRNTDIVGRFGGDEFVAYLPAVKSESAIRASLDTLRQKVASFTVGNEVKRIHLAFSAGCTFADPTIDTFSSAFKKADTALYHIKRNGKNDFAFYIPEMQLSSYKFECRKDLAFNENDNTNKIEVKKLFDSIGKLYPLILSVNLTNDDYYHISSNSFIRNIAPTSGSYMSFTFALTTITKREDKQEIIKLSAENLIKEYTSGNTVIRVASRQIGENGKYNLNECTAVMYKNDAGEICAFLFGRGASDRYNDDMLTRIQKIMDFTVRTTFEYVCILHPDTEKYEIIVNDNSNTHDVPIYDDFNKVTKSICDTHVIEEEREQYYKNAVLDTVAKEMNLTGGHYHYGYTLYDGKREAEFYWFEPTHTSILMTVKKIKD